MSSEAVTYASGRVMPQCYTHDGNRLRRSTGARGTFPEMPEVAAICLP